jgi:hypothetical protein
MTRIKQTIRWAILALVLVVLLGACAPGTVPATPAADTAVAMPAATATPSAEECEEAADAVEGACVLTGTVAAGGLSPVAAAALRWEEEINGACFALEVQTDGEAATGPCGNALTPVPGSGVNMGEWEAIQTHFGAVATDTDHGYIAFQGSGRATSPAWARALAIWAEFTAMEQPARRTAAATRTALAWRLGEVPWAAGECHQLLVLAYGYAYVNQIPCTGSGQAQTHHQAWLTDEELATFQGWMDDAASVEGEPGYLDAQGSTPLAPAELTAWAEAVVARMTGE